MRTARGRGNDARKILTYYSINFDVHPPFQVLCDGPIISLSIRNNLYLKQSLPRLLGNTAYPVVTNCVVSELKSLGEEFSGAALFAKRLTRIPCANDTCHELEGNASGCILARLRKQDDMRLMLATNDTDIMRSLTTVAGVPLITVENQTKLVLRPPGRETLDYVRRMEGNRGTVVSASDRAFLKKVHAEAVARIPQKTQRREQKKRKRAKGPNPLSVRKAKRAKPNHDGQQSGATGVASPSPGKVQAGLGSDFAKRGNLVQEIAADANKSVEKPNPKGDNPVPGNGKDDAEQVDASDAGKTTSQPPLPAASGDKAKRKRPRNRKTSRNSKSTRDESLINPDSRNQVVSTPKAGDDAGQNGDNEGQNGDNEGQMTDVPKKAAQDIASTDQHKLRLITNKTQTVSKPQGESVRGIVKVPTFATETENGTESEKCTGRAPGDVAEKGRSVGGDKTETNERASVGVKSASSRTASPRNVESKDSTDLTDPRIEKDGTSSKIPERGPLEAKTAAEEVQKKKKHRNNRRRRPKKIQDSSINSGSAPTTAKGA